MSARHNYLETPATKPTASEVGKHEIVINDADGTLWSKANNNVVFKVGGGDGEFVTLTTDQEISGSKKFNNRISISEGTEEAPTSGIVLGGEDSAVGFLGFNGTGLMRLDTPSNGLRVSVPNIVGGDPHEFTFTQEGYLSLYEPPIHPQHAANKGYVDTASVNLVTDQVIGGSKTFSRRINISEGSTSAPTAGIILSGEGGGVGFLGFNGTGLMRLDTPSNGLRVSVPAMDGGDPHEFTFTQEGHLALDAAPIHPNHATNKGYVDSLLGGEIVEYVDLTTDQSIGGNKTFTERLNLRGGLVGAPTSGIILGGDAGAEGFLGFNGTDLFHLKAPVNGFRVNVPDLYGGIEHEYTFTAEGNLALDAAPEHPNHAANRGYVDGLTFVAAKMNAIAIRGDFLANGLSTVNIDARILEIQAEIDALS